MKKFLLLSAFFLLSCSQEEKISNMELQTNNVKLSVENVKQIADKKIYFGHQSVGYNIIDGLKTILPSDSGVNIIETSNTKDFSKPVFAHSQNGENTKPETKIAAFLEKMDSGLGNKVDIAFFKFCYVDITCGTDVKTLFVDYKKNMEYLISKYPGTTFLHITVPLVTEDLSLSRRLKDIVKKLIGKKITTDAADNIKRTEFNTLLKTAYGTKVFNLAEIESSDISGNLVLSKKGAAKHQFLQKDYTSDGGHLNEKGKEFIASHFIMFIISNL